MMSSTESKTLRLCSSDGETYEVDADVMLQSQTIKFMIEDGCAENVIPIPNVTRNILSKVIDYCMKHHHLDKTKVDDLVALTDFHTDFVDVDQKTLFDTIMAANYLEINSLLQLLCEHVASMVRFKSTEEIRKLFNIRNDLTPEEEAKIAEENAWAFDAVPKEEEAKEKEDEGEEEEEAAA